MIFGLSALVAATLFTGAALYISFVEHPARLGLADGPLLAQWQPSYKRALPIQAGLAIIGGIAGFAAWFMLGSWLWAAGALVLLANWPFTLFVIMPVNKRLQALHVDQAGAESRRLLLRWGRLHDVRGALGAVSAFLFGWGMLAA